MLLRALRSEGMKCRRSPVWAVFLVLPLFPAIMGTLNYLGTLEILDNGWYSLWSQHTIFSASFFMPAQFGVFCAWQWRLEHTDHNWNSLMTAPVPVRDLYWSKFLLAAGVAVLGQVCIGVLYLLSGQLAGVSGGLPLQLAGWMFFGALGGMAVCAVQLFLSLVIRSFAPPVALGLVGGIAGLVMTSQGAGLYCPYSLLCLGMRANNPNLSLEVGPFVLACGVCIALFSFLTIRCMAGRDVTTG